MTENVMAASQAEAPAQPLHILSQARERQGMHLAVLAVALKVSIKKIEALEAGRFDELPGNTFARALAASACRHLKIDPAPVLALIPPAESPQLGYAETIVATPFYRPSLKGRLSVLLSHPAALVALVLVVGALAVFLWPFTSSEEDVTQQATISKTAPVLPLAPADTASTAAAPSSAELAASQNTKAPAATPVPTTPSAGGNAAQTVAPSENLMSIRATSDSWVEVRSVGGPVLLRRLLKSGEVVDFSAPPPYNVLLGRVDAAVVTVRGQPFDTTPFARNSVARFEVK